MIERLGLAGRIADPKSYPDYRYMMFQSQNVKAETMGFPTRISDL